MVDAGSDTAKPRWDNQANADAIKQSMNNSTRAGLIEHNGQKKNGLIDLKVDDTVTYKIISESFKDTELETQKSSANDQTTRGGTVRGHRQRHRFSSTELRRADQHR